MHHPTYRIAHTKDVVTPVMDHWLEQEIAQWVHPMKDRSDDPSNHERTLLPRIVVVDVSRSDDDDGVRSYIITLVSHCRKSAVPSTFIIVHSCFTPQINGYEFV